MLKAPKLYHFEDQMMRGGSRPQSSNGIVEKQSGCPTAYGVQGFVLSYKKVRSRGKPKPIRYLLCVDELFNDGHHRPRNCSIALARKLKPADGWNARWGESSRARTVDETWQMLFSFFWSLSLVSIQVTESLPSLKDCWNGKIPSSRGEQIGERIKLPFQEDFQQLEDRGQSGPPVWVNCPLAHADYHQNRLRFGTTSCQRTVPSRVPLVS